MTMSKIDDFLEELYPNPICELHYSKDYELLMAVVLSAQSTDKRVNSVTPILFGTYPTLKDLKEADLKDLEHIIRPIGSYHKKASYIQNMAMILEEQYEGKVPTERSSLEKLPGVGRKTANVFLSEYYDIPAIAVDTHVERVSKRLGLASRNANVLKIEKKLQKVFPKELWGKRHLQLVLFGRYFCKAVKPNCKECSLVDICKEKKKNL